MAGLDIRRDFVAARDAQGSAAAWDNLLSWEAAKTYSKKLGTHTATSAIGAAAGFGLVEALDTPLGQTVKNFFGSLLNSFFLYRSFYADRASSSSRSSGCCCQWH